MSLNKTGFLRTASLTALLTLFAAGTASAAGHEQIYAARQPASQCKIIGAISHRCLNFHSDSAWPAGLADYHGTNGG
jgi:hypothetical protein